MTNKDSLIGFISKLEKDNNINNVEKIALLNLWENQLTELTVSQILTSEELTGYVEIINLITTIKNKLI